MYTFVVLDIFIISFFFFNYGKVMSRGKKSLATETRNFLTSCRPAFRLLTTLITVRWRTPRDRGPLRQLRACTQHFKETDGGCGGCGACRPCVYAYTSSCRSRVGRQTSARPFGVDPRRPRPTLFSW